MDEQTNFAKPAILTFPLPFAKAIGSQIPVFKFNFETLIDENSELLAIVNQDGESANVKINEIGRYTLFSDETVQSLGLIPSEEHPLEIEEGIELPIYDGMIYRMEKLRDIEDLYSIIDSIGLSPTYITNIAERLAGHPFGRNFYTISTFKLEAILRPDSDSNLNYQIKGTLDLRSPIECGLWSSLLCLDCTITGGFTSCGPGQSEYMAIIPPPLIVPCGMGIGNRIVTTRERQCHDQGGGS